MLKHFNIGPLACILLLVIRHPDAHMHQGNNAGKTVLNLSSLRELTEVMPACETIVLTGAGASIDRPNDALLVAEALVTSMACVATLHLTFCQ